MRWILVFILLYIIPLAVLFRNYKSFKRACVYGSIYVTLSTVIVITNIYLSGVRLLQDTLDYKNDIVLETYLDQYESNFGSQQEYVRDLDLQQIDDFKKDIYSIERTALIPMRQCLPYKNNLQKSLSNLTRVKKDIIYAKEMCKEVVDIYDKMKVPDLSKEEYTEILDSARLNVKKTYELRMLAMESSMMLIDTKNPMYINKITQYLKSSDKEISNFKEKVNKLKKVISEE